MFRQSTILKGCHYSRGESPLINNGMQWNECMRAIPTSKQIVMDYDAIKELDDREFIPHLPKPVFHIVRCNANFQYKFKNFFPVCVMGSVARLHFLKFYPDIFMIPGQLLNCPVNGDPYITLSSDRPFSLVLLHRTALEFQSFATFPNPHYPTYLIGSTKMCSTNFRYGNEGTPERIMSRM